MPALHPFLKRLRAAPVLLLLAACANRLLTTPYVAPPPGVPSARLLMRNAVAPADSYDVAVYADAPGCSGRQRVGAGTRAADVETTRIAADRWQTVDVTVHKPGNLSCTIRWSFMPRQGRSYVVFAGSTAKGCSSGVRDVTTPDIPALVEATLRRRDVAGVACLPLSLTKPVVAAEPQSADAADDLPIGGASGMPSAPKPPAPAPAPRKPPGAVTTEDLQGLIGH